MSLQNWLNKQDWLGRSRLLLTVIFFSFLGVLDTSYLLAEKILGGTVKCIAVQGCDTVLQSSYSVLFGFVPASLAGFGFYLVVLMTATYLWSKRNIAEKGEYLLLALAIVGIIFSAWFFYVQAVVLDAYCTYCLISAFNTIIILGAMVILKIKS